MLSVFRDNLYRDIHIHYLYNLYIYNLQIFAHTHTLTTGPFFPQMKV